MLGVEYIKNIKMKRILSLFAAAMLFGAGFTASAQQQGTSESGLYVPGALYVQFKDGTVNLPKSTDRHVPVSALFPAAKSQSKVYGLQDKAFSLRMGSDAVLANTFCIYMDSLSGFDDFIKELQADSRIESIERVPMRRVQGRFAPASSKEDSVPDDPFYGEVGGINTSWHLEQTGFPEIYGKYAASPDIRVAIVDNAVWGGHPDLQLDSANMYDAYNSVLGSSAPPRYVGQNQPGTPPDRLSSAYLWSHGTHCAGLAGAITGNGEGVASYGSGATLVGVKAANDAASDALPRSMEAVVWASEQDVDVISMSFGSEAYSGIENRLFNAMVQQGIILLAAAGNDAKLDVPNYPADYAGVISVGALNSDGSRASFSNYGSWVDVWTPGGSLMVNGRESDEVLIFSTTYGVTNYYSSKPEFSGKYYDAMAGTSMATPLTTGIVSLILSYYPELNAYQMCDLLQKTARDGCTYVPAAMQYMENLAGRQVDALDARWNPSTKRTRITWEAPDDAAVESYRIVMDGETIGETPNLFYEWTLSDSIATLALDTTAYVGVAAIYDGEAELPVYTRFMADEDLSNSFAATRPDQIRVYVDHAAKTVRLPQGLGFDKVEVYNIQGALMRSVPAGTATIDMSGCSSGMYIGRVFQDGMAVPFKFVL